MFSDREWLYQRTSQQEANMRRFLKTVGKGGLTIIEIGAGTAVPTIRMASESVF